MKKLNRKGYVTVEVLISSVIAAAIAVFLIDLTVKLVSKTDDAYIDVTLTTDKALIIDNIKSNILYDMNVNKYGVISGIDCTNNKTCNITFANSHNYSEDRFIIITDDNIIKYCVDDQDEDKCFYAKKLDSSLSDIRIISNKSGSISDGDYVIFTITGKNIFSDKDYSITIPILNKYDPLLKTYKVEIKSQFGTSTAETKHTFNVVENSISSSVDVSGNIYYPAYDSVSCTNCQGNISSKTTSRGITTVSINVSNVTGDAVCTVKFKKATIIGS